MYNFLVYFTRSRDVEDLVQETFVRALRGIAGYQGQSSPKVWLLAIARNIAIDFARKQKRTPLLNELSEDISPDGPAIGDVVVIKESTREVLLMLDTLKANYRNVIILRCIQGMSAAQTAEILGWNTTKVNVTYHRALKHVREIWTCTRKERS